MSVRQLKKSQKPPQLDLFADARDKPRPAKPCSVMQPAPFKQPVHKPPRMDVVHSSGQTRPASTPPALGKRLLTVREAALVLGLSKSTLDKMRCSGSGPRFIRATGRAVRYDPDDLAEYAAHRRQRSTSEQLPGAQ